MFAPGLIGIVMGVLILFGVKDSPESAGFLPVERVQTAPKKENPSGGPPVEAKKESLVDLLVNDVLK